MSVTRILVRVSYLLLALVAATQALGQSICNPNYPVPDDEGMVFYLQRSGNSNTVVYTANTLPDGSIDPSDPVDAFWRYLSGSGRKADLRFWERNIAFGVRIAPLAGKPGRYIANLNAAPDIQVRVEQTEDGKVKAIMPIDSQEAQLVCIYVEWREQLGLIPKVLYVDFHGFALDGGRRVFERLRQ